MSEDSIKRSDAAEVVYKALKTPPLKGVLTDTMSLAIALVRDIPSADRPQEWIPCSERKPTTEGHYLCSLKKPHRIDNIYVGLAYWTGGRWYGYLANEINAWMPLPMPWKGADDE